METFRIRALRTAAGMTLAQLAAAAQVSPALISQVERGLVDPSLATLRQIARVLGVPLFGLFDASGHQTAPTITRAGAESTTSPSGHLTYALKSDPSGAVEVLYGRLAPGGVSHPTPWSHPAEECVVVVSGTLVVEVNSERHQLNAGDSCYFDSRLPHRMINTSDQHVELIVAVTPPSY